MPSTNLSNAIEFDWESIEEAFPKVDHNREATLSNYIVQLRRAKQKTKGGILLPEEARKAEAANTTVGKVVALGPDCFKNPRTWEPWPGGPSFKIGDFIQIPRFGGFLFSEKWNGEEVDFRIFDHLQQLAKIRDPLKVISYL